MLQGQCFVFIFPMMPGDLNPSLPVARELVAQGHHVHYVCFEQFRDAIEDTGAILHDAIAVEHELYNGREPDIHGAFKSLKGEYGCQDDGPYEVRVKLNNVQVEKQLPGLLRLFDAIRPSAVVYDPVLCPEACIAGKAWGVPTVALLAYAGPGGWEETIMFKLRNENKTCEQFDEIAKSFEPNLEAIKRMNDKYGLDLKPGFNFGRLDPIPEISVVSTIEDLKQPESEELQRAYKAVGAKNVYVGPLLDKSGAKRAGAFRIRSDGAAADKKPDDVTVALEDAKNTGRPVVFASLGTVTTGDDPALGWHGRPLGEDGLPRGATGRMLCKSAWGTVCKVFGSGSAQDGPLILVSLGSQPDALEQIGTIPPNAICQPFMPQVDILKSGLCSCFLTHGGQNSFMESLSQGVPMLVCPTTGDQFDNAKKAEALGVGLDGGRPDDAMMTDTDKEESAMEQWTEQLVRKLQAVSEPSGSYKTAVSDISSRLAGASSVSHAVQVVLETATRSAL